MLVRLRVEYSDGAAFVRAFDQEVRAGGLFLRGALVDEVAALEECEVEVVVAQRSVQVPARIAAVSPGLGVAVLFGPLPGALADLANWLRPQVAAQLAAAPPPPAAAPVAPPRSTVSIPPPRSTVSTPPPAPRFAPEPSGPVAAPVFTAARSSLPSSPSPRFAQPAAVSPSRTVAPTPPPTADGPAPSSSSPRAAAVTPPAPPLVAPPTATASPPASVIASSPGEGSAGGRAGLADRLRAMSSGEKIQLALSGDRLERLAILRDVNRTLHLYVLKNPRLGLDEVQVAARTTTLAPEALELIGQHSEWSMNGPVCVALVRNPKTPMPLALRLLDRVPMSELRAMAKGGVRLALVNEARRRLGL